MPLITPGESLQPIKKMYIYGSIWSKL